MTVELIRVDRLYDGVPYAYAARAPGEALLFTAGACPLDEHGATVAPGDVRGQARQVLANLQAVLEEAGSSLSHVLKSTIYVATTSQADLVTAWDEIRAGFGDHDAPSTLLGVAVLGYTGQLVEIEAVALIPE